MKRLTLLFFSVAILFSCDKDGVDDPAVVNYYQLLIKNTDGHLTYSKVELAGHTFTMTSQEQSFTVDGDIVAELENKQQLVNIGVKLFYECLPCSDVRGCNYDEDVVVEFKEQSRVTKIDVTPRTDGFHQFNHCAHKHEVSYN